MRGFGLRRMGAEGGSSDAIGAHGGGFHNMWYSALTNAPPVAIIRVGALDRAATSGGTSCAGQEEDVRRLVTSLACTPRDDCLFLSHDP
jgi:hypothetical protein